MTPQTPPDRLRLFVALELPSAIREAIGAWQSAEVEPRAELRAVRAGALHITLCFLGCRPAEEADGIAAAMASACEELVAPRLQLRPGPLPVPARRRPRLFALDVEGEGAGEVYEGVASALEAGGFHEREKRPFWPHVTACRVRQERRGSRRPARVHTPPGPLPAGALEPFDAVRVALYRSMLRPTGAEYEPVAAAGLRVPESR